jgi:hypothetical protein
MDSGLYSLYEKIPVVDGVFTSGRNKPHLSVIFPAGVARFLKGLVRY